MTDLEARIDEKIVRAKHIAVDVLNATKPENKSQKYLHIKDLREVIKDCIEEYLVSEYKDIDVFLMKEAGF